ncbi:MAG: hypothetical protein JJE36_00915 [Coriobacteriia bacterium]|nr:hypothetical protein [Coriobacteriia bacterium]
MKIDKSNSPTWVRVTVWVTTITFIFGFAGLGLAEFFTNSNSSSSATSSSSDATSTATAGTTTLATINAQYQTQAVSTEALVKKDPKNAQTQVELGSLYSQWAQALSTSTDKAAQSAAPEKFKSSATAWAAAYELDKNNKEIGGDYATSLYYTGDTAGAVKIAKEVLAKNPKYATVWFNLGIYLSNTDKTQAVTALENAVKYDTDATTKKQAQTALDSLKKASN